MKRESNEQPLKEVLDKLLENYKLKDRLTEVDLRHSWKALMGPSIARHTREIYLHNKVLTIHLDSSVLREELSYAKDKIIANINEHVGREIVKEVALR